MTGQQNYILRKAIRQYFDKRNDETYNQVLSALLIDLNEQKGIYVLKTAPKTDDEEAPLRTEVIKRDGKCYYPLFSYADELYEMPDHSGLLLVHELLEELLTELKDEEMIDGLLIDPYAESAGTQDHSGLVVDRAMALELLRMHGQVEISNSVEDSVFQPEESKTDPADGEIY